MRLKMILDYRWDDQYAWLYLFRHFFLIAKSRQFSEHLLSNGCDSYMEVAE